MKVNVFIFGLAGLAYNLLKLSERAILITDEQLAKAAEEGANTTVPVAPIDTGAYRYGGVSRRGTEVANGIVSKKIGNLEYAWGTPAPYGRRLELGFNGRDSLGRYYNDPARPHFGPSMPVVADFFIKSMVSKGFTHTP